MSMFPEKLLTGSLHNIPFQPLAVQPQVKTVYCLRAMSFPATAHGILQITHTPAYVVVLALTKCKYPEQAYGALYLVG